MQHLKLFRGQITQPEHGVPGKIIAGEPKTRTWNHGTYLNEKLYTGVWEATPGSWHVRYDEWEYCYILEGKSIITDKAGNTMNISAGDSFVIEPGFSGTWTVTETVKKNYVILMPPFEGPDSGTIS